MDLQRSIDFLRVIVPDPDEYSFALLIHIWLWGKDRASSDVL